MRAEAEEGGSGGRRREEENRPTLLLRRRKAGGRAASSASRTCQQERSSGATGGRRCHLARSAAVTQAAAPAASAVCLSVCLGVAWSPRPDICAQRDGCSVVWLASRARGLRPYWPTRASWGVTRPISGRCVSRRGLVVVGGRGQHTRPNFAFPLWPQWPQWPQWPRFQVITGEQRQQQINQSELLVVLLSSAYLCNNVKYTSSVCVHFNQGRNTVTFDCFAIFTVQLKVTRFNVKRYDTNMVNVKGQITATE